MTEMNKSFAAKPLNTSLIRLSGSNLIEASAGTGKTYTIAMLYLRFILGHEHGKPSTLPSNLSPKDILVVTFTEAATKELSDRIRSAIAKAVDVFDIHYLPNAKTENSDLVAFRDSLYPDRLQWPECQKKLMLALELMDEASISTIHSWCFSMLTEHAFDSGNLFDQTLRKDESDLLNDAIRDYWRIFVYPLGATHMEMLTHYFISPDTLKAEVKYSYKLADQFNSEYTDLSQLPAYILSEIKQIKRLDWQAIIHNTLEFIQKIKQKEIASTMHGGKVNAIVTALNKLQLWLDSDDLLPENFAEQDISKANKIKRLSPSRFAELADPKFINELEIVSIVSQLENYAESLKSVRTNILSHASRWILKRIKQAKAQASELGFDELIKGLHTALQQDDSGKLKHTIAEQFPVVMIDEFQDTDNLQYEIFNKIYDLKSNNQDKCLLLIGDPKQAIYSFRGGDIYTYLQASFAVGENKYTLDKNYRSTDDMVASVNYIFEYAQTNQTKGAFAIAHENQSLLPFEPVLSNGLKERLVINGQDQRALTFFAEPEGVTYKLEDVAESVATQIIDLLNKAQHGQANLHYTKDGQEYSRPIQAKDIAVLVRGKTQATRIQDALSQRQLRSYYVSDRGSILNTIEAHEILIWLKAVAQPSQINYLRAALASSILSFSIQDLYKNVEDDMHLDQLFDDFSALHKIWKQRGVFPMLKTLLFRNGVSQKLLNSKDKQERTLTNILHIAELLQEASLQIDGMQNLINYYEDLLSKESEDDEFLLPRLESEKGLVQIVTYHKSKGLQYPIVFIPYGLTPPKSIRKTDLITYHDEDFERRVCLAGSDEQISAAEQENLAESIRTFYVAITRAQYATFIGLAKEKLWYKSAFAYLLNLDNKASVLTETAQICKPCPHIEIQEFASAGQQQYLGEPHVELAPARQKLRRITENWQFHSYSSIQYQQHDDLMDKEISTYAQADADIAALGKEAHHLYEDEVVGQKPSSIDLHIENTHELMHSQAQLTMHNFYKGATAGTFLHNILEWCSLQGFALVLKHPEMLVKHIEQQCNLLAWSHYKEVLCKWIMQIISAPLKLEPLTKTHDSISISLSELTQYVPEMEFLFATNHASLSKIDALVQQFCFAGKSRPSAENKDISGMFKGFIDLSFAHDGKYYVLDYKSNFLGESKEDYSTLNMHDSILSHRYDLQYVIYIVALHRMLKNRIKNYRYEAHVGGAIYYLLRCVENDNQGIFTTKPPFELIQAVDELFLGDAQQTLTSTRDEA